jgi:RNA polymerase sigma factor (sigma-70 family)
MVLGACRGLLKNPHDAEDAFQATFLTLARKAGSLRRPELLGPWLHGVACHTARRLRDKDARRRRHEAEASMSRATHSDGADRHDTRPADPDEIEALHEEIARLPEKYRTEIVLCDLQGLTHREAGHRLGRPAGTIAARLSRARERLRGRLTRRGLVLPAGIMGLAGSTARASTVPAALADSTITIAMAVSSGQMAASVAPTITNLSRGVTRSMLITRLAMTSAAAIALGAGATGVGILAQYGAQGRLATVATVSAQAPQLHASEPLPEGARLRLGTSRFRPPSMVAELALSPDETTIVTAGDELIAWDASSGKERWRARGREYGFQPPAASYGVRAVAFAPDGSRFYTPGRQGEVVAWETSSGRREVLAVPSFRLMRVDGGGNAGSIDVAPDGRKLAMGDATGVVVFTLDKKVLYSVPIGIAGLLRGPRAIDNNDRLTFGGDYGLARFSPDGKRLAVVISSRPEELRVLEAETGRELRRIALAARLVRMAFSPDSQQLATTERDSAVRLYDLETGKRTWSRVLPLNNPFENYTSAVAFSPDGKIIAAGATDNRIHLIDATTGDDPAQLVGHHWYPWALAFGANGRRLYSSGWDPAIRRWDVAARKEIPPPGVRATSVVAASPDGRTLAYEDDSDTIRLVDAGDGAERRTLSLAGTDYSRLGFSANGRLLAGGGTSGDRVHVAVWDVTDGRLLHRWDWPKGRDPHSEVESLAFTADGSRLAAAVFRQSSAYLWDLTTGRQVARILHNQVYGLSFSPDDRTLATAGWDSIVRFWEADSGELQREVKIADRIRGVGRIPDERRGHPVAAHGDDLRMFAVCYAPEGEVIATAHLDGTVRIWQADDMVMRRAFPVHNWFREGSMSLSPDGLWLATGLAGGLVDLWDPMTGEKVWDRGRHQGDVYTVGFGRDSRTLVSGGQDGVCYLWDLRPTGERPPDDPARLWEHLAGDDGPAAYRAIWALSDRPDRAVALLAEKLRPVKTVIDLDRVEGGSSHEENQRRRRMRAILIKKDPKVASALAVRRAVSLLAQIGTPEALALLNELAKQDPKGDLGRFAATALARPGKPSKP